MCQLNFKSLIHVVALPAVAVSIAIAPAAYAQDQRASLDSGVLASYSEKAAPEERYADALALQAAGDAWGAFVVLRSAAQGGHAPAQRRLGEIYDAENSVVDRNYAKSIRWYQLARAQGEAIPVQQARGYGHAHVVR